MEKETRRQIATLALNVSINNISTFTNILTSYSDQLEYMKYAILSGEDLPQTFRFPAHKDTIFRHVEQKIIQQEINSFGVKVNITDSSKEIEISVPVRETSKGITALTLKIPLLYLHDIIAEENSFSYAYMTLVHNDIYIFHPDESMIGLPVPVNEKAVLLPHDKDKITEIFSNYLNIPVYKYSQPIQWGGETWIVSANLPSMNYNERITRTRSAFIYITLLTLLAFSLIYLYGFFLWKQEFVKAQKIQEDKISLELKHEQQKKEALTHELEYLRSGLNHHFLFNSLYSLKVLVNKDPLEAERFVIALSNLYRYILKNEKRDMVTLKEEVDFTNDYIFLQQIRFKDMFVVTMEIDEQLLEKRVPPVSLQLLIENCIKHTKMSQKSVLHIFVSADTTHITVKNNYNPPEKKIDTGMGLKNLTRRYALITTHTCSFQREGDFFIAKIPLLPNLNTIH